MRQMCGLGKRRRRTFEEVDTFLSENKYAALESLAASFLVRHSLPAGINVYEMPKLLGERFVFYLPWHSLVMMSRVHGPEFTRDFIYRAISPNNTDKGHKEKRNFIYVYEPKELLWKAAAITSQDVFDAASGDSIDLEEVWATVRPMLGDVATMTFQCRPGDPSKKGLNPDPTLARGLLGKAIVPLRVGLHNTIDHGGEVRMTDEKTSEAM
ncbi:hypothetical protein BKA63DRAFT_497386 [Paraphoma chrysanthemicola]|nr:hypothetical protein BKA63DRAFT_497386 [Paraphoma chrysanthemicola]